MDSWASSACYPRRTFYPLSDGPSTRDHRITMAEFPLCSSCRSRSQAGLCHCTQGLISDQPEPTIARLRYSLGGDRPSQTTRHAGSRPQLHGARLDARDRKGGISRVLPPLLLTFRHRAGVRPYTSSCDFAEPCVFSKQSPPPLLCPPPVVAHEQGPLLPKLRGHFAEFLQHRSLKRLGMLYQSTSVGFG